MIARRPSGGRRDGASQSRTGLGDRYRAWIRHHRLTAAESLQRVLDNRLTSLMTWLVIGIALALPAALDVALENADQLSASWDSPAQLSLFLQDEVDASGADALAAELEQRDGVVEVKVLPREQALAEFSQLSGFADVLDSLERNPLPNLLLVTPRAELEAPALRALSEELAGLSGVARVVVDMEWLQRLNSLMALGRKAVLSLGLLLVLGVVLILGNTIRLAIENRREEIVIVKLVGGSNPFVRRPFLYTGLWYGLGGGAVAAVLVALGLWYLRQPVADLASLYDSNFRLRGLGVMGSLNLVMLGGVLGLAGAWLAVARHLSAIEPR